MIEGEWLCSVVTIVYWEFIFLNGKDVLWKVWTFNFCMLGICFLVWPLLQKLWCSYVVPFISNLLYWWCLCVKKYDCRFWELDIILKSEECCDWSIICMVLLGNTRAVYFLHGWSTFEEWRKLYVCLSLWQLIRLGWICFSQKCAKGGDCGIFVCWLHYCLKQIFSTDVEHDVPTWRPGSFVLCLAYI